jgi:hypothetical protein
VEIEEDKVDTSPLSLVTHVVSSFIEPLANTNKSTSSSSQVVQSAPEDEGIPNLSLCLSTPTRYYSHAGTESDM